MALEDIVPVIDLFRISIKKYPYITILATVITTILFGEYWPQRLEKPIVTTIHQTKIYSYSGASKSDKVITTVQRISIDVNSITLYNPTIEIELPFSLELVDQDMNPPLQCSMEENALGSDRKIYYYKCSSLTPGQSIELTFTTIEEVEKTAQVRIRVEGRDRLGVLYVESAQGNIWVL